MSHANHREKIARARAKKILEIQSGTLTVYTAYLIVCIRLIVLVAHTIVPGLQ